VHYKLESGVCIVGQVDMMTSNCLYEIKCVDSIKQEHILQVILYGHMTREIGLSQQR
jgi:hypothetical protein